MFVLKDLGKLAFAAIIALFCVAYPGFAQVPVSLAPNAHPQFLDNTGKVLSGGFIFSYAAGTTNRQDTYTDSTGTIINAWPIPLDSTGAPSNGSTQTGIWITSSAIKLCAYTSALIQVWCTDNILGTPFLAGNNAWTGTETHSGTETFSGAVTLSGGGTLTGGFAGSPSFTGNPTFTGSPIFSNNQAFPLGITTDAITGTITNGGTFQLALAAGTGTNNGENFNMQAGNGPTGNIGSGGFAFIGAGNGGSNGGNGGLASLSAGNATSSNGAGGAATINGGNAVGTAAGGSTIITAGQGGLTGGPGGNAKLIGGAGGTGGIGGDVQLTPGAGSGAANGSVIVQYGRLISSGSTTQPTCASTGLGATGNCALSGDSGDSWGEVTLTVAGAGPAASGTVTLTFVHTMGGGGSACVWNLNNGSGTWNSRATVFSGPPGGLNTTALWDDNSVALTAGSSYNLTYFCGGRQ